MASSGEDPSSWTVQAERDVGGSDTSALIRGHNKYGQLSVASDGGSVVLDNLPVVVSAPYAKILQQSVSRSGKAWFPHKLGTEVEFVIISNVAAAPTETHSIVCNSEAAVEEVLRVYQPIHLKMLKDADRIIHSDLSKATENSKANKLRPSCSIRTFLSICNHFNLSPSYTVAVEGNPGIQFEPYTASMFSGANNGVDFFYSMPAPWLSPDDTVDEQFVQVSIFSILNYTRMDSRGLPSFTMFSNLPSSMAEAVKLKWHHSILQSPKDGCHPLYDHYELIGQALHEMRSKVKFQEMFQRLYGANRLAIHVQSPMADIRATIDNSQRYVGRLGLFRSSLSVLRRILQALQDEVHRTGAPETETSVVGGQSQDRKFEASRASRMWNRNLMRHLPIIDERLESLIQEQHSIEALVLWTPPETIQALIEIQVLSYIAQRDRGILSRNSNQMTQVAKATEKSGHEIHEMTKRMELDARETKFLAEIAAFFLPLTALAAFFSMDFMAISGGDEPGLIPTLRNAKFLWLYFAALIVISIPVFGWWYYKRVTVTHHKPSGPSSEEADLDLVESRMETQKLTTQVNSKSDADEKLAKAAQEWENYLAGRGGIGQENSLEKFEIFTKMVCAERAREIGEDFDELLSSMSQRK